jgi:hypothetical protein
VALGDRRTNLKLAQEIDRAIVLERTDGAVKAWAALAQLGMSPNAIRRLLGMDGVARRRQV